MSRREQILGTAAELFAKRGFHGVSVADLGAAVGISGPALYKHFPSKDDLVVAYLEEQDRIGREAVAALPRKLPREMIVAILSRIAKSASADGYRGCPFLNASAEYPDPSSPVRQVVDRYRTWQRETFRTLIVEVGAPSPARMADLLVALSDCLLESAYLDDPKRIPALISAAVTILLP